MRRGAILKGELGIGRKAKDLPFDEARKKIEAWAMASKKPGTAQAYQKCLRRLAESFSGTRFSALSPFLVEKHKQARIQAGLACGRTASWRSSSPCSIGAEPGGCSRGHYQD